LLESYLKAGVMETLRDWKPTECGTPQGAVISPLLTNIYLDPLDHQMAGAGWQMTRYADDFIIQCRSREEAEAALPAIRVGRVGGADVASAEDPFGGRDGGRRL
jgi:RNA-directed DNA polymerase